MHVVDKFWDPDPLVALVIDPGRSGPLEGAPEIFMTSMSNDPCPHKIDFSRHHGRRSVPAGRGFMYRLFSAYPEREMLDGDGGQDALLRLVVIRIGVFGRRISLREQCENPRRSRHP